MARASTTPQRSLSTSRQGRLALRCRGRPVVDPGRERTVVEAATERCGIVIADHDDRARTVGWAAEAPEGVVPGVGARDAQPGAEACDRARLAVVARVHDGAGALGGRQPVPDTRNGRGKGRPADRLDRVLVDRGNRRRVDVLHRHEREDECSRDRRPTRRSRPRERGARRRPPCRATLGDDAAGAEERQEQAHRVVRLRSRHEHDRE